MKVTFVLPDYALTPVGGFRIVYTYANALATYGHDVTLVFSDLARKNVWSWSLRVYLLRRMVRPWYELRKEVSCQFGRVLPYRDLPDADAVVATAVQTADLVADLPRSKGTKFYLVQHFEDWAVSAEEVRRTWQLPMEKLAISKWLRAEIMAVGSPGAVRYLPNPFDTDTFYLVLPPAARPEHSVAMMWSSGAFKRAGDGLAALEAAHLGVPQLRATLFGTEHMPARLPSWINYVRRPYGKTLRDLYNSCAIFLHTSESEGWGLPPGEAMACGCAVVATRNRGVLEYLHEGNAVLADVGDVGGLANAIATLVRDLALRTRLVNAGMDTVRSPRRSTDYCARRLERVLSAPRADRRESDRRA